MIKSIALKNWKNFESATLYIDPLTILIGTNAAGKSNILDAFIFLQRIASGLSIQEAIEGTTTIEPLRGGSNWVVKKPSVEYTIQLIFEIGQIEYSFEISIMHGNSGFLVSGESLNVCYTGKRLYWFNSFDGFANSFYYTTGKQGKKKFQCKAAYPAFRQLETLADLQPETVYAIESLSFILSNLFVLDPIPSKMRGYSQLSKTLRQDASNTAGVLAAFSKEDKDLVEGTIAAYVKMLPEKDLKRIFTVTVGPFNTDAILMCEEGWEQANSTVVDASGMSDGTLRYLAIVAALLTRPENSLFIIEEVDNGLHPSRARNLLEMLKTLGSERNIDILITTHNPALLDAAGHKMIPFIFAVHRDSNTGFGLITPLDTLDALPKLMASGTLGDISTNRSIENALRVEVST
ncbi:MAG: AAA family ATPase [Oscillospiraceae bacterium]|nr:AAA family ATPase [Oscillospiraceae bacterium]